MQDIAPDRRLVAAASPAAALATPLPSGAIFIDDAIRSICSRADAYMHAGVPVHPRGPAGIGKTALAHHIAGMFGRPVSVLTGDHWLSKSDMAAREVGATERRVQDTHIRSVKRSEIRSRIVRQVSVPPRAMEQKHSLNHDAFPGATPEANNTLLSVLEERMPIIPRPARAGCTVAAHPGFRAIVTSNPDGYVGVNLATDALLDRMLPFDLAVAPARIEAGIVAHRTGSPEADAAAMLAMVPAPRAEPGSACPPSIRTRILIARLPAAQDGRAMPSNGRFVQVCLDVLAARARPGRPERRICKRSSTPLPGSTAHPPNRLPRHRTPTRLLPQARCQRAPADPRRIRTVAAAARPGALPPSLRTCERRHGVIGRAWVRPAPCPCDPRSQA